MAGTEDPREAEERRRFERRLYRGPRRHPCPTCGRPDGCADRRALAARLPVRPLRRPGRRDVAVVTRLEVRWCADCRKAAALPNRKRCEACLAKRRADRQHRRRVRRPSVMERLEVRRAWPEVAAAIDAGALSIRAAARRLGVGLHALRGTILPGAPDAPHACRWSGKPCEGKPQARFDEEGLRRPHGRALGHRRPKGAATEQLRPTRSSQSLTLSLTQPGLLTITPAQISLDTPLKELSHFPPVARPQHAWHRGLLGIVEVGQAAE
jgi:hypothetical protein